MTKNKEIILLGSTGSIGTQTIDLAKKKNIRISALSANRNVDLTEAQAREIRPLACAMADEASARDLRARLSDTDIKVYGGEQGVCEMIATSNADCVLDAISGAAGLAPALAAIDKKKTLALANKESLVMAGDILMQRARDNGVEVRPIDSEHSAIWQCLRSGKANEIKKLIITASGGPFFGQSREQVRYKSVKDTLAHPTWNMGAGITVDSATLMNKGFEVIEAAKLFGIDGDRIDVIVHRESIIHSMVEYIDNSVIAQLSVPDMRICINYALGYPDREAGVSAELDLCALSKLTFYKPDTEAFPLLAVAFDMLRVGGAMPAVLNAANEIAVGAFLKEEINFGEISETIIKVTDELSDLANESSLEAIIDADKTARARAKEIVSAIRRK
ncbi:MAG: 1-deoxy-D-xylulose-5-phosphate reductoisomerase [Clostridia bacterium]|nr:1-deoxy-D-xylulose-5-phosphate reductoisomerase [Clostridia bacterium]